MIEIPKIELIRRLVKCPSVNMGYTVDEAVVSDDRIQKVYNNIVSAAYAGENVEIRTCRQTSAYRIVFSDDSFLDLKYKCKCYSTLMGDVLIVHFPKCGPKFLYYAILDPGMDNINDTAHRLKYNLEHCFVSH